MKEVYRARSVYIIHMKVTNILNFWIVIAQYYLTTNAII